MHPIQLKPIDSNLRRIKTAFERHRIFLHQTERPSVETAARARSVLQQLQELHLILLGTMVSVQSGGSTMEPRETLDGIRKQIITYRVLHAKLVERSFYENELIESLAKQILLGFYDLEGIVRKRTGSKQPKVHRQSQLIAAIAEKSKSALALSMKQFT